MSENNSKVKKIMITIVAIIIIAAIAFFYIKPLFVKKELPKPVALNTNEQPTLGNPNAKVHIVAFEDLKCSNCARFNVELMPYIKKEFIDSGIAKYTVINLAFINGSMPAANAAHCVFVQNPTLFFNYTDYIFTHQPPESDNWATVPNLLDFASKINGIDVNKLGQCILKSPYDAFIQANLKQAMTVMKGTVSTPSVYINGVLVRPLTKSHIKEVIEAVK